MDEGDFDLDWDEASKALTRTGRSSRRCCRPDGEKRPATRARSFARADSTSPPRCCGCCSFIWPTAVRCARRRCEPVQAGWPRYPTWRCSEVARLCGLVSSGWLARWPRLALPLTAQALLPGRRVRLVDGSSVCEPGATGSTWRLHYASNLHTLSCDEVHVSEADVGESLTLLRHPSRRRDHGRSRLCQAAQSALRSAAQGRCRAARQPEQPSPG